VTLPAGLVITSGQLVVTNFFGGGELGFFPIPGILNEPLDDQTFVTGNGTLALTDHAPYSTPGTLTITIIAPGGFTDPNHPQETQFGGTMTYALHYTVASRDSTVPEPAIGFGIGIGALVLAVRSRRARRQDPSGSTPRPDGLCRRSE